MVGQEIKQLLFVTSTLSRFESASIWYSLKLSNLMTDFSESIAFLSIVNIFISIICRYSPWQIRIFAVFAIHPRFPSPLLILSLFPVNNNVCRVLQVSLVLRFKFKTDLIINWIYPVETHSRETWGKSTATATNAARVDISPAVASSVYMRDLANLVILSQNPKILSRNHVPKSQNLVSKSQNLVSKSQNLVPKSQNLIPKFFPKIFPKSFPKIIFQNIRKILQGSTAVFFSRLSVPVWLQNM